MPGSGALLMAVIFPAAVILIELMTGMCANSFFNPLPTPAHLLLVAAVPFINYLLWRAARQEDKAGPQWLALAGGGAMAIAGTYALLMLPLLPIAAIGILVGVGLLPFAPVASLVYAIRWTMERAAWHPKGGWRILGGIAIGLLLLTLADLPATATYMALNRYRSGPDEQRGAVSLMRNMGDREILLSLAYGDTARATGIISTIANVWGNGFRAFERSNDRSDEARELYYRVTGAPFNATPRPTHGIAARGRWLWDADQGGDSVGGRIPGLALATSRIDGSVATTDSLAYVEWTLEIANRNATQHEARFTIDLPGGAVASRATLWINGVAREASIAGKGEARAVYAKVVRVSRDPLLVTTDGAQRLLVQAFPIPAGGTLKLRIGMTAPFVVAANGRRSLAMPAIVERNFDVSPALKHELWIDGDGMLAFYDGNRTVKGTSIRWSVTDGALIQQRPMLEVARLLDSSVRSGRYGALSVRQVIARAPQVRPSALMLVVDGSANNRDAGLALAQAIDAIPDGVPVGLAIAADMPVTIAPAPWSAAVRARYAEAIKEADFAGGQDSTAALADAIAAMPGKNAALLWLHGPQPVVVANARARLEQVLERSNTLPRLVRYQAVPGRAFTVEGKALFDQAQLVTPSGDPVQDLRSLLGDMTGSRPRWAISRTEEKRSAAPIAPHLVRLWAAGHIAALSSETGKSRGAAIKLAHQLNLVTPVSGAVVLETDTDYKENGLPVPSAEDVPTIPEPETWALLAILAGVGLWLYRHRRMGAFA